jgi:hypothetical protein
MPFTCRAALGRKEYALSVYCRRKLLCLRFYKDSVLPEDPFSAQNQQNLGFKGLGLECLLTVYYSGRVDGLRLALNPFGGKRLIAHNAACRG